MKRQNVEIATNRHLLIFSPNLQILMSTISTSTTMTFIYLGMLIVISLITL